ELTIGGRTEFRWIRSETVQNKLFFDASLFSRYQFPIMQFLNVTTNFSLEVNQEFGVFFSPRLILYPQLTPEIKMALEYQHARRLPDFFELYWNRSEVEKSSADSTAVPMNRNQFIYTGNPNLSPEYIDNLTLHLNIKPRTWIKIKASPFIGYAQNFISLYRTMETESSAFINQKQVYFLGYDQRLEIQIFQDLKVDVNFHYLMSRDENRKGLPDLPNLTASGLITYRRKFFQGNLKTRFHLGARLLGERWNLVNGNYPFPEHYFSSNLSHAGYEPALDIKAVATIRDMDIFFSFENLMGRKYHYLAGYPMRELAYYWGINWKFWD
ncbi:TonB-dependent receptor, partial [candidate division KSB1 bacterium]|nr:TonB-dependent receptor [candidate division KSB1 bacterium]